ncbi:MAG TPA: transposase [Thermomicrobiales bacterium]|nr:transposase [Thermomicrobiales bacterium]
MPLRTGAERRSLRLRGWDYRSPGPYAITLVTQHREWRFGSVIDRTMVLNDAGTMVAAVWGEMADAFARVTFDAFVVMPNHLHAIVRLCHEDRAGNPTLGDVVQRFKTVTTALYSDGVHRNGWPPYDRRLWQNEYYDHIIRDADDLDRSRRYIIANPANWDTDRDRDPTPPS